MKLLIKIMAVLVMMPVFAALSGCREEPEHPEDVVAVYQNIATYTGDNDNGRSMLQYREVDDSPIVTLTLQGRLNQDQVKPGTRLLVTYTLPAGVAYGTSCDINASSLNVIYNGAVETDEGVTVPDMESTQGIYVMTLYRSGEYVNLMAQLPATNGKRKFRLVADASTLGDDVPKLYLTTEAENELGFNRKSVASLNMGAVWELESCKGVELHIKNTNNRYQQVLTFLKNR